MGVSGNQYVFLYSYTQENQIDDFIKGFFIQFLKIKIQKGLLDKRMMMI
jgi:hypothetical protein